MDAISPIEKDIVLLGGGHSHLAVLKSFGMKPIAGIRLTLISQSAETPYSGMLPGHLAGHYTHAQSHIDLAALCHFARAQFFCDVAMGLNPIQKQIECADRPPVSYDVLSIDIGSTPSMDAVSNAKKYAIPIKPIDRFLDRWAQIESSIKHQKGLTRIVIVGGGAGGVELALNLEFRLRTLFVCQVQFTLIARSQTILPDHNHRVRRHFTRILKERGIAIQTGIAVQSAKRDRLHTSSGLTFPFEHLLWVTHACAPKWIRESGLEVDAEGFIGVNEFLQSPSHPSVFASGDIATMLKSPRPKSGVFAVRQGIPLARNLRAAVLGKALIAYRAQRHFLSLISSGEQYAVASRGGWMACGKWIWKWKDHIDRRFMRQYQNLPTMHSHINASRKFSQKSSHESSSKFSQNEFSQNEFSQNELREGFEKFSSMRCVGCGSKIGPNLLKRVMRRLPIRSDSKIMMGLDCPDDAAVFESPDAPMVQSVDHLPAFLNDPWLFARIATIHCLGDVLAMGAKLHSAQIIATIPYGFEKPVEETLFQTMSGAIAVLNEHRTPLIGGHTLEGPRLELGMIVNGIAHQKPFQKNALKPEEDLILTQPIGTGLLLAASMRGEARHTWLLQAMRAMLQSPISAIDILHKYGVQSVSDITGFGLIGHLSEMLEGSNVDARLFVKSIPLLEGAAECARRGIASSLYPQNKSRIGTKLRFEKPHQSPLLPILFDPQTAGGLLFGVKKKNTNACLRALWERGWHRAAKIGETSNQKKDTPNIALTDAHA